MSLCYTTNDTSQGGSDTPSFCVVNALERALFISMSLAHRLNLSLRRYLAGYSHRRISTSLWNLGSYRSPVQKEGGNASSAFGETLNSCRTCSILIPGLLGPILRRVWLLLPLQPERARLPSSGSVFEKEQRPFCQPFGGNGGSYGAK